MLVVVVAACAGGSFALARQCEYDSSIVVIRSILVLTRCSCLVFMGYSLQGQLRRKLHWVPAVRFEQTANLFSMLPIQFRLVPSSFRKKSE